MEALLQASRDAAHNHLKLSLEELFDADQTVFLRNDNGIAPRA